MTSKAASAFLRSEDAPVLETRLPAIPRIGVNRLSISKYLENSSRDCITAVVCISLPSSEPAFLSLAAAAATAAGEPAIGSMPFTVPSSSKVALYPAGSVILVEVVLAVLLTHVNLPS